MPAALITPTLPTLPPPSVAPLREGDRMDVHEFVRRWEAMPEPRPRAELLEGTVHFLMPTFERDHSSPHADLIHWLKSYQYATPGILAGAPGSLRLDLGNMPEPDAYLRILETHGGRSRRGADGCVESAPELVAEVAGSTVRKDLGIKRDVYLRHGVAEYLVWRTRTRRLDWLVRRGDAFVPKAADADGIHRSEVFPGLWLDAAALLRGDMAGVARAAQQGIASPEHAAFVQRLRRAARLGRSRER